MYYIVATDGSTESVRAVEHATRQAIAVGGRLEIVHVLTPQTELIDGEIVLAGEAAAIEHGKRTLTESSDRAATIVDEQGSECELVIETELLAGRPAVSIAEHAADVEADGVYVGHRGLSEAQEQVVGSVAKSLVDKATVPVTIIK